MAQSWPNDITQYSTISALMSGYASSPPNSPQTSHLQHYGDHGLGTFPHLNGEMVMIDSVPWKFTSDGKVARAAKNEHLPFVMVTQFRPQFRVVKKSGIEKDEIVELFESKAPMKNGFVVFKVKGLFEECKVRIVCGQKNNESLTEVAENAVQKTFTDVEGTIFGIYSPPWSQGISVAGVHAHFLSSEQADGNRVGGHVLSWTAPKATVEWAISGHLHMGFPNDKEFHGLDLGVDAKGIEKSVVQGPRSMEPLISTSTLGGTTSIESRRTITGGNIIIWGLLGLTTLLVLHTMFGNTRRRAR